MIFLHVYLPSVRSTQYICYHHYYYYYNYKCFMRKDMDSTCFSGVFDCLFLKDLINNAKWDNNSHLTGLSIVVAASKYVHVSIQGAAARPRHGGRDFSCHVKNLPLNNEKEKCAQTAFISVIAKKNETAHSLRRAFQFRHSRNFT